MYDLLSPIRDDNSQRKILRCYVYIYIRIFIVSLVKTSGIEYAKDFVLI